MKKVKVSELTGTALDWAVAQCRGIAVSVGRSGTLYAMRGDLPFEYQPAHVWAQGGPIIEREEIGVIRENDLFFPKGNEHGDYCEQYWRAEIQGNTDLDMPLYREYGPTPLIAAMRCFVSSKLGEEIDIPEELL